MDKSDRYSWFVPIVHRKERVKWNFGLVLWYLDSDFGCEAGYASPAPATSPALKVLNWFLLI